MKFTFIPLAIMLFVSSAFAQKWTPQSGSVKFKLTMMGVGVDGTLSGMKANIDFNPDNPSNSSMFATVDANTVFTDNKLRDSHLKEKTEFFEPAKYPVLTLKSNSISKTADGYVGEFSLTIKNVTKPIKIPFKFTQNEKKGVFSAKFEINRKDWKFGGNTLGMGNNVTISLSLNTVSN
jgi:polyisoprenoid-binding protein YceI